MSARRIGRETYYSLPEAARRLGVSHKTMFRWVTRGVGRNGSRMKLQVLRDVTNGRYYVSDVSLRALDKRFKPFEPVS